MARAALHINDAGIVLLNGTEILYRQPGFALLADDGLITGNRAFAEARINPRRIQHRYWSQLATLPLSEQLFSQLSAADLVSGQLESMWKSNAGTIDELVVAAPTYMSADALGLFLGIAAELGMPVIALVESAVAATRREYRNAALVHVDISLHNTTLTRMAQPGRVQAERNEVIDGCGVYAMFDAWLTTVAEAFVRQSRFDPLHTAETEQQLLNRLGGWLAEAGRQDVVGLELESGGIAHRAEIEVLSLIGAVAPWYQQIANRLRALFSAHETPAIQLTDRVARLPGLAEMLKARVGGEVFVLEAGATARGALARCRRQVKEDASVSLLRQLPWDQAAMQVTSDKLESAKAGVPTHLLFDNIAYRIDGMQLELGSQGGGDGARRITLRDDMPGVSRRHCSVSSSDGQCVVEDYSRYGTFLNGHRINGSTVLQVGDTLRIGTPGYEFQLITTDESHGA
jgi:hypothetical protein